MAVVRALLLLAAPLLISVAAQTTAEDTVRDVDTDSASLVVDDSSSASFGRRVSDGSSFEYSQEDSGTHHEFMGSSRPSPKVEKLLRKAELLVELVEFGNLPPKAKARKWQRLHELFAQLEALHAGEN